MLDASVLIEHFRKKTKGGTLYSQAIRDYDYRSISVVAKLEVLYGVRAEFVEYWNDIFATMTVVPFTDETVAKGHEIILELRRKNLLIEMEDIMVAATASVRQVPLATLNRKHFERIDGLALYDDKRG